MYCEFYGMRERPFNVTADPKFLYLNARYREALASLHYGVTQRKGFITLIGEAGTGKTTLLKKLLNDLDPNTRTVFVFNTNVTFDEILEYIFGEFDLPVHNGKRLYMLQRLNAFLLDELREGRNVALLVDEAQDLDFSVMEDLRLLSNLETSKEKILQIVLAGQPELGQKLTNPSLRQLRQRVAVNCRLMPLTREELSEYLQSRLSSAGCDDPQLFSHDAQERVYEISGGIPRIVNVVCDNTLVIGYAMGKKRLTAEVVDEAAADLIATEGAPEVMVATRGASVDAPHAGEDVARSRWTSPMAVMVVVAVALTVGLLSVGRKQWSGSTDGPDGGGAPLEVVQPGLSDRYPPVAAMRLPVAPEASGAAWPNERAYEGGAQGDRRSAPRGAGFAHTDGRGLSARDDRVQAMGDLTEPRELRQEMREELRQELREEMRAERREERRAELREDSTRGRDDSAPADPPSGSRRDALADRSDRAMFEPPDDREPAPRTRPGVGSVASVARRPAWSGDPDEEVEIDVPVAAAPPPASAPDQVAAHPVRMRLALPRYEYVQVVPEDSISEIAIRHYGQASPTILDLMKMANPKIRDINQISPGQTLRLPQLDQGLVLLRQSDDRYGLLLISLTSRKRATEIRTALRRQGFGARMSSAELGGGRSVWRVIIGDLESRKVALQVGKDLQQLFRRDRRISALAQP